jgi:hypothetical protein
MCFVWGKRKMHIRFGGESLKKGDNLQALDVDEKVT